ncbi:MAG: hypothetical protein WAM69_17105 [Candidatus Sulfotelmatobacter sp.]
MFPALAFLSGCGSSSSSATTLISAAGGTPQSATVNTAFAQTLQATVTTNDGNATPLPGLPVTFTVANGGTGGGTFANGTATETDMTDVNGNATSSTFTASTTPGGPYTVSAAVAGESAPAAFSLTNNPWSYSFYLIGLEQVNNGPLFYALAGSVQLDGDGNVLGGEQDYNDAAGLLSPQPGGDTISAGALTVDATTGQGTLSLITSNAALGVGGTEILGVQFVNANHALIVQFDGTATSSGSMDLQTSQSTSLPTGMGYAFTLSGVDPTYNPVIYGGVFSINGTTLQGSYDENDAGDITPGTAFSGKVSPPDNFGRGTITGTNLGGRTYTTLNYYIVGPEAVRIIDVDAGSDSNGDSAVGSAFGQGINPNTNLPNTFSSASLGSSVFGVEANPWLGYTYAAAGQLATTPGAGAGAATGVFTGVADNDEEGSVVSAAPISAGHYHIALNGYGTLTIPAGDLEDLSALGIYLTDPNLNLLDPNNTAGGLGGALVADLDTSLVGTGILIPQTDITPSDFTGNYSFGGQDYNDLSPASGGLWGPAGWEFDFLGQGSVTNLTLGSTTAGLASDPFGDLATPAAEYTGVGFSGTAVADATNPGRYTVPLSITVPGVTPRFDFNAVLYQANAGQLLWVDEDASDLFFGSLQQQGLLTGLPPTSAKKAVAKGELKRNK